MPQHAIRRLADAVRDRSETYFCTEVGQHQMWAAQFVPIDQPYHWISSGGLGTMGYGLPAAIGAQIAHPNGLVIDIAGDNSLLMNIQELNTIVSNKLPVKIYVINNQWMGMVRQWQDLFHGGRLSQTRPEVSPDLPRIAEAFGCAAFQAEHLGELDSAIAGLINTPGPALADIRVVARENCFPMIPAGGAHDEMILGGSNIE
jgi:acetolactate synthase-1/2/3 large subunit